METIINQYYERFKGAETVEDKKQIAAEFRAYFESLPPELRTNARAALQPLMDATRKGFERLDSKVLKNTKETILNVEEKGFIIARLLDLIERMQYSINLHSESENPDTMAIEQYTELRERYRAELAELLKPYGLDVKQAA
jgi:hypothetical protein